MTKIDQKSEETIFSAAMSCAPAERAAYLDKACAGDPALRQRIEDLLQAQPQLGTFMEDGLEGVACDPKQALRLGLVPEEGPGTRIGRYKLLQKLGEGGCGAVYMAEQEEPVRRRVALKVIKLGMDTKQVIARFEAERQALAMMDHPNIAKVLDGGTTETGRPYFVMELVRGIKVTEFCDQNRLSTRERLDLFIQVCQAVQHAHQKGIIHRDLKPSNILVTVHDPNAPGVPVVIDFGIAKATQGRLTDQTLFTAFEQFLGTPAYMSPEQTLMTVVDVDTRSDIYSLGVLLYELLTGRTPFDAKELLAAGFEEMRRTIRDKEPLRPSTRLSTLLAAEQVTAASVRQTEPPKLVHLVRGDLDWIVMKCLEKDRARRYETANALAMDLQRHLKNEPVLARPPSRLYEFQKTVRRHKVGFGAAAAVITALTVGVLVSLWQAREARRAAGEAQHNAYIADMHRAQQALVEGDLGTTRELLGRYLPAPGRLDLRGWEWRYLAQESRGDNSAELRGHHGSIGDLRFLNDTQLLSVGLDRRIIWWDWPRRTAAYVLTNAPLMWNHDVTSDRRTMALIGEFQPDSGYLLDTSTRQVRLLPVLAPGSRLRLAYLPSGAMAIGSAGRIDLWDGSSSKAFLSLSSERIYIDALRVSPNGQLLAVATEDGRIGLWSVPTRQLVRSWQAHQPKPNAFSINHLRFSPDGRWLVSSGPQSDRRLCVWETATGRFVKELEGHRHIASPAGVLGMEFSPDGQWLATAGGDQTLRIWDTSSWTTRKVFHGHLGEVKSVAWALDGGHLVSGSSKGELLVWEWPPPTNMPMRLEFLDRAMSFRLSPSADALLRTVGLDQNTEVWQVRELTISVEAPTPKLPFTGVCVLSSKLAATGETNGSIRLWDLETIRQTTVKQPTRSPISAIAASADGRILVTWSVDGQVRVWELPSLTQRSAFSTSSALMGLSQLAVSPDGSLLALGLLDGHLELRELPSGRMRASWQAHSLLPNCIVFSPDGRLLASHSQDETGAIWDLTGPKLVARLTGNPVTVLSLAFSPDATRLAAGVGDGTVRLYDASNAAELAALHRHKQPVASLAFSADGTELVSVSEDALCRWRAPELREFAAFEKSLRAGNNAPQ